MKIKICLPFYQDFDGARSGLSELKKRCKRIARDLYRYDDLVIKVCLLSGTCPKGVLSNKLVNDNITQARNDLVETSFDYCLFIDSDIIWRFEDLLKLIKYELPIVAAPYIGHVEKHLYQCGTWLNPGESKERFSTNCKGLKEVDWVGMGLCLIKTDVFKNLEYPWFRHQMVLFSNGCQEEIGEDYGFCLHAQQSGYKIMVDFDIKLKHLPPKKINWSY